MGVEHIFNETRLVPSIKCCVSSKIEKKNMFGGEMGFHWKAYK